MLYNLVGFTTFLTSLNTLRACSSVGDRQIEQDLRTVDAELYSINRNRGNLEYLANKAKDNSKIALYKYSFAKEKQMSCCICVDSLQNPYKTRFPL